MTQIFLARQAIFNTTLVPIAYELLYRHDPSVDYAQIENADEATAQVLFNTFQALGLEKVTGNLPAYINLPRQTLLSLAPHKLPKDKVIIEVLENAQHDDALYQAISKLKQAGYTIALDDFIYTPKMDRFIELANIVKIDVLATPVDTIQPLITTLQKKSKHLIAEKIETHSMLITCQDLGMTYFQGYYLGRPEIISD